jgi:hypothetical protein
MRLRIVCAAFFIIPALLISPAFAQCHDQEKQEANEQYEASRLEENMPVKPHEPDQVVRLSWLNKTAPRAAGMGGAFTAVSGDPIGMWWNPSAAMHTQRLAISGTHSLRHFPGEHKNLDQFDSDLMGMTIPLANTHMLGLGFTVPGEWGIDYADTNGALQTGGGCKCPSHGAEHKCPHGGPGPFPPRVRGRERRIALGNIHTANNNRGLSAAELQSDWYRTESAQPYREFRGGVGFSFYYEADNGFKYGATVRVRERRRPDQAMKKSKIYDVTLGVAYREDPQADTLAALDLQWIIQDNIERSKFYYYAGVERKYRDKAFARVGVMQNNRTWGVGARFSHLRLDFAEVEDLLPDVAGQDPGRFRAGRFLSYTLTD